MSFLKGDRRKRLYKRRRSIHPSLEKKNTGFTKTCGIDNKHCKDPSVDL
jgi:hypothetical protein